MKLSVIMEMVKNDFEVIGLSMEGTYKKAEILLKMYRRMCWCVDSEIDDITYKNCLHQNETLIYLLDFVPEKELNAFTERAKSLMESRILLQLVYDAVIKVKEYPDYGQSYYDIIDLKYLNSQRYTNEEAAEILDMDRSTFCRKRKEAVYLIGYVLFGFVMPDYIKTQGDEI
ncbi:MAG: hypothetical protein J1F60_06390 [Oscillospiraceae bacterium]|nr:hypothetical protein [Oscillospiraceae bacterium]